MKLTKEVWAFIVFNNVMATIFSYTSIFVNLFIWGNGHNLEGVTVYNLISYIALFLSYMIGSRYLHTYSGKFVMTLSAVFTVATFVLLFYDNTQNQGLMIPGVATMSGMTSGLFWAGNNSALYFFLKPEDYTNYYSMNTMISQTVTILVPLLSSAIVYLVSYRYSFLFMLMLVVVAFVFARKLPDYAATEPLFRDFRIKTVFTKPGTKWLVPITLSSGTYAQFQNFFSMIYIFSISNNVVFVALMNVGFTIMMLFGLFIYKRTGWNDLYWLMIGIGLLLVSYSVAFTHQTFLVIFLLLLMKMGNLFFNVSNGKQTYRIQVQDEPVMRIKIGMWLEVPLVIARSSVLLIVLILFHYHLNPMVVLIPLSTIAIFAIPALQKKAVEKINSHVATEFTE